MLAIVDYGAGNQTSVARALAHLGIPAVITASVKQLEKADGIIFPGVGAAPQAMNRLQKTGMDAAISEAAHRGQPLLGICLGCQILLDESEEGNTPCLGIFAGRARRFHHSLRDADGAPIRVPHMGWNSVAMRPDCPLFTGIPENAEFYFVHGYYPVPQPSLVLGVTSYGLDFCSVYGEAGIWAVQFHPEKSGVAGLKILENFNIWCMRKSACCPKES